MRCPGCQPRLDPLSGEHGRAQDVLGHGHRMQAAAVRDREPQRPGIEFGDAIEAGTGHREPVKPGYTLEVGRRIVGPQHLHVPVFERSAPGGTVLSAMDELQARIEPVQPRPVGL